MGPVKIGCHVKLRARAALAMWALAGLGAGCHETAEHQNGFVDELEPRHHSHRVSSIRDLSSTQRRKEMMARRTLRDAVEYALPAMGDDGATSGPKDPNQTLGWTLLRDWAELHSSWSVMSAGRPREVDEVWEHANRDRGELMCVNIVALGATADDGRREIIFNIGDVHFVKVLVLSAGEATPPNFQTRACGILVGSFGPGRGIVMVGSIDSETGRKWTSDEPLPLGGLGHPPDWPVNPQDESDILR